MSPSYINALFKTYTVNKTVLLAGDFRQILFVIVHGTEADEINACLKSLYIYGAKFKSRTSPTTCAEKLRRLGRIKTDQEERRYDFIHKLIL